MALRPITTQSVDRFTSLIIGEAGTGKTSLLRTIPKDEKVCCLSSEAGLLAVRDMVSDGLVEGYEITSFADMREAYQLLLSTDFQSRYKWVFIDSLTEISSRCVEAMKSKYTSKADSFNLWGEYSDLMQMIIKGFRDLQAYSVVFTCLPSVETDEFKRRYVGAAIAGKQLQERLTSYFDLVLYMTIQQSDDGSTYRAFYTQPIDRFPAKDRSGKLSPIEKPDLSHIQNKILNS